MAGDACEQAMHGWRWARTDACACALSGHAWMETRAAIMHAWRRLEGRGKFTLLHRGALVQWQKLVEGPSCA